jgi:hypothetical protein
MCTLQQKQKCMGYHGRNYQRKWFVIPKEMMRHDEKCGISQVVPCLCTSQWVAQTMVWGSKDEACKGGCWK